MFKVFNLEFSKVVDLYNLHLYLYLYKWGIYFEETNLYTDKIKISAYLYFFILLLILTLLVSSYIPFII